MVPEPGARHHDGGARNGRQRSGDRTVRSALRKREIRRYVNGNIFGGCQNFSQCRRHHIVLGVPGFDTGPVAAGLEGQQLFGKARNYYRHGRVVDGVAPVRALAQRSMREQIIELHHFGAAVGFAGAKAKSAENARYIGAVDCIQTRLAGEVSRSTSHFRPERYR